MKESNVKIDTVKIETRGGGYPLVSIIIPVYNAEKYLRECLDSIVNQTYSNLQIICLNDGSTDNCPQILDEYATKDSRFHIVCQQNTGQGIAKFNALPLLRGKYTMTVDADDWIDLNTIEKCVRIIQEKDTDVVVFTHDKRNENGTKNDAETARCLKWQFSVSVNDEGLATDKSEVINTNCFWGKLFLTELLLTNFTRPGNRMAEDCVALWQVIPAAKQIVFLPENLYHYRFVGTSCCNTKGRHHLDSLNNCRIIYEELMKRGQYQEYSDCFLRFLLSTISCNFYMTVDEDRYEFLRQFRALLTKEMKDYYRSTPLWSEHRCWLKKYGILEDDDAVFDKHIKITLAEDDIEEAKEKIRQLKGKHKPVKIKTILVDTARRISRRIFGTGTVGNFILRIKHLLGGIKQYLIYLFSNERVAYARFLTDKVRPLSVLLIEPNECHGVVIPGYAKYLSDLGYNVDILMTTEEAKLGATAMLAQPQYRQYTVTWNNMRDIIEKQIKYNDYTAWFFTSSVIYNWERSQRKVWCTVSERFPNLPLDKTVFVSHHKEYNDSELLRSNRLIMLADFLEGAIVSPYYFGKVNITPKNDVVKFFVVGTIYPNRRNFSLLFSAVEQLAKQRQQFTVTAIGEGFGELQIPQSIRQYFNITGKIPYPDMFRKLEDADYFLPLLDPDKPKHNRYITEGTSGNFLLIYGFRKPAIIAGKFALPHHLTNENAIIYETNDDLTAAMRRAIELPRESYSKLQEHLAGVADDIYQRSLDNLRKVVGTAVPVKAVHKTIVNLIQAFSWKLEVKAILNDFIDVHPLTTVQCNNLLCQAKAKQLRFGADTAQDIIAYLFFNGKTFGFFVDIGAHNGLGGSTTFWAEQLGWKGICVEPQPSEFQALQRNRRCTLRNCAVSNKTGTAEFISFPDSTYWSGLAETMTPEHVTTAKKWISEYHHKFSGVQRFTVQTNTFDDIMRDFPDVSNIDFLSIDTEGHELPVLQSIDFSKYRFGLIAIETRPDSESSTYLEQQGYQILLVTRSDTIFVPCSNTNSLTISSPPKKIVQCNKRSNKELMGITASWTHSLELEYVRTHNPSRISKDEKIKIFYYDTYISNKCNLRCNQCCNLSPFRKTIPTKEELIDSYDQWSKRIDPEVICVGGGEPLLHPDFQEVMLAMRRCFPNALIQLITNGMLLPKLTDDNIKELFDAGRIVFRVSRHLNNDVVLNRNIERLQSLGMPLDVQNCCVWWSKSFCTDEQEIPYPANNDPEKTAAKCYGKVAVYLGNVFSCCLVANAYYAVKEGVLGKEWQFLRQHKPMTLANTQQEILNYITKEFTSECSMCPEDQFATRVPARQLTREEVETVLRNAALSTLPKIKLPI